MPRQAQGTKTRGLTAEVLPVGAAVDLDAVVHVERARWLALGEGGRGSREEEEEEEDEEGEDEEDRAVVGDGGAHLASIVDADDAVGCGWEAWVGGSDDAGDGGQWHQQQTDWGRGRTYP